MALPSPPQGFRNKPGVREGQVASTGVASLSCTIPPASETDLQISHLSLGLPFNVAPGWYNIFNAH